MSTPAPPRRARNALIVGSALAVLIALSACDPREAEQTEAAALSNAMLPPLPQALPMTAASAPLVYAPAAERLPMARQLAYADPGDQGYAWIDRADTIFDVIGDAPPDYGFDYDDVEPWGWEAASGYVTYAEPINDGYYRYYYYEPDADYPYLVRDPWYSYGYSDGRIAAVYDSGGALLPLALAMQRVDYGSRYYARAHDLRRAARRERRGVAAPVWAARRLAIERARQQWAGARNTQPAWRQWRQRAEVRAQRQQLRAERETRRDAAQRFASWQENGLRGRPPALYTPQRRPSERVERQAERAQRQAQRQQLAADRAVRQAQRAQFMDGRRDREITPAQQRRREMMQPRLDPHDGAREQIRVERQAERAAQRQARIGDRANEAQVQARAQQRAQRQAERAQHLAQRRQQAAEGQRRRSEMRQRAERQQRDSAQLARRQQAEQRRSQMAAQRASVQRQQRDAQRAQLQAARAQQQHAAREQAMAARRQQDAARQQQVSAAREQRAAARQQAAQQQQQSRQAAVQARAERRAERGGGGGGERRGRRD